MRIAVVGAAGYVGLRVTDELLARGHDVLAVVREHGRPSLERRCLRVRSCDDLGAVDGMEAVVNAAHPHTGPAYDWPRLNQELLSLLLRLAGNRARVIHLCTLSVFGDQLERPAVPGPVAPRRDIPYVECKLVLQDGLLRALAGRDLSIVRLGNVWGPGSPMWTARLVDRLRAGRPVGLRGRDGYGNLTDVGNVAAYVADLLADAPLSHPSFHHLAELGDVRWSVWTDLLARALGVQPIILDRLPTSDPPGDRALLSPASLVGRVLRGRITGSLLRSFIRMLPIDATRRLRARLQSVRRAAAPPGAEDALLLRIMSCERRFECHVRTGWHPPVDRDLAWSRVESWLAQTAAGAH